MSHLFRDLAAALSLTGFMVMVLMWSDALRMIA